tara:strand:+ start:1129 stop:2103 length:975 start_codon:yes stop_codon:yes gene_type:complete
VSYKSGNSRLFVGGDDFMPKISFIKAGALGLALLTSGCSSFDGMPEPVITSTVAVDTATKNYMYDSVIAKMGSMEEGPRTVYRNRAVSAYLMAMDARYFDFRRGLARNIKGGNLGLDLALLGLTGSAAIWDKAASELAAVATAVAGGKASLNRELYFEKTLPALIALMEAERLTVRADILRGLTRTESDYTIEEAFSDLTRYQSAASLDGAIQRASEVAASEGAKAKYDYSKAIELCAVSTEVAVARRELLIELNAGRATPEGRKSYAQAAAAAGMVEARPTEDETEAFLQSQKIGDFMRNICTMDGLDKYENAIASQPLIEGD